MKNNDMFEFDGNDIYSSSSKKTNSMQDIVSDTQYYTGGRHYYKKKKGFKAWWARRKKWQKATMITATSIVLVFAVAIGTLMILFDYNYNDITKNPEDLGFENVIDKKIVNVALFGIDAREKNSFKGLSDSIMILSLNTETKKVKVISIMRDSVVAIEKDGNTTYTKINSAYSKGGPELAIKTINKNFGLDISEYATVNFYGMTDIVDAVGGIDVTLTKGELNVIGYEYGHSANFGLNGMIQEQCSYMKLDPKKYYINEAGEHHLNGIQAVAYARIRKAANADGTNNDDGRTDRQRYVMEQLFNKAVTLNKAKYVTLAKALIPCSETSLSYNEIMSLAGSVLLHSPKFEQARVPQESYKMPTPKNTSFVYYDLAFATKIIHAFIYDNINSDDYIEQNGVEKNDWYSKIGSSSSSGKGNSTTSRTSSSSGTTTSNPSHSSNPQTVTSDTSSAIESTDSKVSSSSSSSKNEGTTSNNTSQSDNSSESSKPITPDDGNKPDAGGENNNTPVN